MIAKEVGGSHLWHGADTGDGPDLAFPRTHQDGRFAAKSEMRKFSNSAGKHGGDSRIDSVPAGVEHAHAGIGSEFRATRHRTARAPEIEVYGMFLTPLLSPARRCQHNRKRRDFPFH